MSKEADALNKLKNAVLRGPEVKRLKVRGHHWNFKKAKREKINKKQGTAVIIGVISHNVKWVDDDQIKYEITFLGRKKNGLLKQPQVEVKIKTSKWTKVASKSIGKVVEWYSKKETAGKKSEDVAKNIFDDLHGDWRDVSHGLVAYISYLFGELIGPVYVDKPKPPQKPKKPSLILGVGKLSMKNTGKLKK